MAPTEAEFEAFLVTQRWNDCREERRALDQLAVALDHAAQHAIANRFERFGDGCGGSLMRMWVDALEKHLGRPLEEASRPRLVPEPIKRKPMSTKACLAVFAADGYKCVHCGSRDDLTVDHIYPVSRGGSDDPENLQTLCKSCNSSKGTKV